MLVLWLLSCSNAPFAFDVRSEGVLPMNKACWTLFFGYRAKETPEEDWRTDSLSAPLIRTYNDRELAAA